MTRIVLDEDGVARLLARLHDRTTEPVEPIRDADDLHEVDVDTELWHRPPASPHHS